MPYLLRIPFLPIVRIWLIAAASCLASAASGQEADWKSRFLKEAPKALADLERYYSQSEGSYTVTTTVTPPISEVPERVRQVHFVMDGQSLMTQIDNPKMNSIELYNKRYMAEIIRPHKDKSYVLDVFVPAKAGPETHQLGERMEGEKSQTLATVLAPCYLDLDPLAVRISELAKRITSVASEQRGNKTFVRVDFDRKPLTAKIEPLYLVIDPARSWCLIEYEIVRLVDGQPNKVHMGRNVSLEYDTELIDGYPRLHQIESRIHKIPVDDNSIPVDDKSTNRPEAPRVETIFKLVIDSFVHKVPEPRTFTLPAYGLSEPSSVRNISSWQFWYWVLAVFFGLSAVIIYRRIRRDRAS